MQSTPIVKESKKINKLLVVGHSESDLSSVKNLLLECNVDDAKNLIKEKITPQEISTLLLKAHGIKETGEPLEQLNINPVWNGLAMDLMMSNIESSLWVWEDPNAIALLEYWKSLDNSLAFILVYNSPEQFIANFVKNNDSNEIEMLEEEFQKWISYNRTLLNFYYRNQDISILVNSEQVIQNSTLYLEQIEQQIGLPKEHLTHELTLSDKESKTQSLESNYIITFIAQKLIPEDMKSLYIEMQSIANLPLDHNAVSEISPFKMLHQYHAEQKKLEQIQLKYNSEKQQLKEENKLYLAQLVSLQEELEKLYLEKQEIETKFNSIKLIELQKAQEENKLLLEQLMNVQEEIEKYYMKNAELTKKQVYKKDPKPYGAANRIRQQLSYRLGAKMIENSKSFGGILTMPFTLYTETKNYRAELKDRKKLPPIHKYADAHEAERLKKHLSYKLGQAMIKSMKSPFGLLKLPFALKKAHTEYKKEKK